MRGGLLIIALLSASSLGASPLDERWSEQVLPLRKGTFEVGLGAGTSVYLTRVGTFVSIASKVIAFAKLLASSVPTWRCGAWEPFRGGGRRSRPFA